LTRLVKAIDKNVAANKADRRTGFVVLLDDNNAENGEKVAAFAKKHSLSLPLTLALEGHKGPKAYNIHPDAPITVLVYKGKKVRANSVLAAPAPTDDQAQAKEVAAIIAAADKALE